MKLIVAIVLSLLLSHNLTSQTVGFNYVPLEFENLEPVWLHDIHDSTIIGQVIDENPGIRFDGFTHVSRSQSTNPRFLVTEDAIILVSKIQYNNDIGGAIIEKLDLETGALEWKTLFDLRTQDRREYVMNISVKDDRLILYCIYLNEDSVSLGTLFGIGLGHLSIKEYDMNNGVLIQKTIPDTTEMDFLQLVTPSHDSKLYPLNDGTIQSVIQGNKFESGTFFLIDTIDLDGIKVNPTDTVSHELSLDWADTDYIRSHAYQKDKYSEDIYSITYFNPNSQGPEARTSQLIRYGERNGREVMPFEYDDYENLNNFYIRDITETHIIMVATKEDSGTDILFIDKFTGVIDRTIYREPRQTIFAGTDLLIDEGEIIVMNYSKEGDYYSIDVYKSAGSEMPLLKSFKLAIPDYLTQPRALHKLEGGDYLLEFRYYGFRPNSNSPLGSFSGIMRITADQLGLTTSTEEIEDRPNPSIVLYPNPATDDITVRSNTIDAYDIIIYDMMGRLMLTSTVDNYTKRIDIAGLPSGHYYVQMVTKGETYTTKLIKE